MPEPTVMLRLHGAGPDDRLRAWVEALGRSTTAGRHLVLHDRVTPPPDLAQWCAAAGVDPSGPTERPDVLVVASAADLPTPGAVRRLVSAAAGGSTPLETRVLPFGASATSIDADPVAATTVCVALPGPTPDDLERATTPTAAATVAAANGRPVRRLDAAAVFVDRRPAGDSSPPPPTAGAEAPPYGHPAALPATPLHQLLVHTGVTPPPLPQHLPARPLLTVVTRTQGTRLLCLEEVLTCLAGQSSRDFELVLTCHRAADADAERVGALLEQLPGWLREATTVLRVDRPGRASPLNDALAVARGRYAVVLDDDDTVTADWVATFEALEAGSPGTVLRTGALRQDVVPVRDPEGAPGDVAPREAGPAHPGWPAEFSLVEHLWDNASPFMTVAFPRGVFDDLGLRFDESLHTNEDWDFLVRAASLAGVSSSAAHTSVYRLWTESEGSRDVHDDATWAGARESLLARMDDQVVLLPAGAARDIRGIRESLQRETQEKFRFAALNEQAAADLVTVNEAVVALRARIAQLEERLERRRQRGKQG